jgi:DNA mismatch endonuclease (patch repair protein)
LNYWGPKLQRNIQRDQENIDELHKMGWKTLVVWECETRNIEELETRLAQEIGPTRFTHSSRKM